jgi:hypothetical protein
MICLFNIFYDEPYPLLEFASKLISNRDDSQVLQAFFPLHFVLGLRCHWFNSPIAEGDEDRAGIFKESMGARHRVGIGLSYRPARLHTLAEFIPWNRFQGSINV